MLRQITDAGGGVTPPSYSPSPAKPAAGIRPPQTLASGQKLAAGQRVVSADGRYELDMQRDGNLVEYDLATQVAVWSSKTAGSGATVAIMQKDGSLVLYRTDPQTECTRAHNEVWHAGASGHTGAYLDVRSDGNVGLYKAGQPVSSKSVWQTGEPAPEQPSALPPLAPSTAPLSADRPASAAGLFKPGAKPLGIEQYTIGSGDTVSGLLRKNGIGESAIRANLAASPELDPSAFGKRAANRADAANHLSIGQTLTVLDTTRLAFLARQRAQLNELEGTVPKGTPAKRPPVTPGDLSATIYQELAYAGTQQAIPDVKQLAAPILSRAPNDKVFTRAVGDAMALYGKTLDAQGRNADQIGRIDGAAAAGDWQRVTTLTSQQLVAVVGNDTGPAALGDISARGGVYLTYAGGDPTFAAAVQKGIRQATHSVLVDSPAQAVVASYKKSGAAAAMKTLAQLTDPKDTTPAQVGQIMCDPRVQAVVKQSLQDVGRWNGRDGNTPTSVMTSLAAACQHATESDQGQGGPGRQAVDRIAIYLVGVADGVPSGQGLNTFQYPQLTQQVLSAATGQGYVSLALALGAQATRYHNPLLAGAAIDSVRQGLDTLAGSVKSLQKQTGEDAAFISVPLHDWGDDSTPAQQQALIRKLLADNPGDEKKLGVDSQHIGQLQETLDGVRMAIGAYASGLKGVSGFDTDIPKSPAAGTYQWSAASSPSVEKGLAALPALPGEPAQSGDTKQEPTNTVWLQRSARKVVEQIGKKLIATLGGDGPDNVLSPRGTKIALDVWSRANKGIGMALYDINATDSLLEAGKGGLSSFVLNGSSAVRQYLASASYGMSAVLPKNAFDSVRPGSGETLMARSYEGLAAQIAELDVPKLAQSSLKISLHLGMQDTSDLASAILGASEAAQEFSHGQILQGVGNVLNTVGYGALLTGPGIDASELPEGATVLALDASAWTGVGAVLVLVGALIYTGANAYSSSHAFDGDDAQWLKAMGVNAGVADQLAKHETSFSGKPPSAGPFLAAYFKFSNAGQADMVSWLNSLTPHQADVIATALKSAAGEEDRQPMAQRAQIFDEMLLQYDVKPPVSR